MDHPDFIVCSFMGNSTGIRLVKEIKRDLELSLKTFMGAYSNKFSIREITSDMRQSKTLLNNRQTRIKNR